MSIDTRDQIDWNAQILQEISYYAGILLFLSRNSKVEKVLWKYSLWRAACNCKFSLSCLHPLDISSHSQDPYHSFYYPRGKCFIWTLFLCSEAPQVVEPVYNERGTLEWLRDAPYVPVKSKLQHPPRATPRAFLENFCSNSPLTGPKSCSNAPTPGKITRLLF